MYSELTTRLLYLAAQLPTGRIDPNARAKMFAERAELDAALESGDRLAAVMEAGDVAYYACKAMDNALISVPTCQEHIRQAARKVSLTAEQVLRVAICKMTLRARPGNPKNDAEERFVVTALLGML